MDKNASSDKPAGGSRVHFPIEGHSIWPVILWVLLFSSMAAIFAIGLTLNMLEIGNLPLDKSAITALVAGFLVLEYVAILKLIVPNMTDYGRYRIYADRVDFFPLVLMGLGVTEQSRPEPVTAFKGVRISICIGKNKPTFYRVDLVHPAKGKTLKLKYFMDMPDARIFACELADAMKLVVMPSD
ncbi:MAG: hypothetical protein HYS17_06475 [Micavibrio aeruginosavorus]|uniref:Uncharacterized protein n=1 Tax=Micavibrio aeruginosavorus TaxID=349221 RepID=A0A7T5R0D6_9BACT|nr:MAG: hypothetical protein HYS17_06475 [Micavibrio aeruginosavorus]